MIEGIPSFGAVNHTHYLADYIFVRRGFSYPGGLEWIVLSDYSTVVLFSTITCGATKKVILTPLQKSPLFLSMVGMQQIFTGDDETTSLR